MSPTPPARDTPHDHDRAHDDAHDHDHAHDHAHADDHDHAHDHAHDDDHVHDLRELGRRRLSWVLALTATFMVVEFVGGVVSNSLALLADAGHMLSDVAAIALSLFALWFARRPATPAKSFGYLRTEILAALANGVTLAVIAIMIVLHAWQRLRVPEPVDGGLLLGVAAGGLLVNIVAALLLHGSAGHSLNIRGAYLHVLGDMLGSVGAIAAGVIILTTGWLPADPLFSVLVAVLILFGSWRLVRESVDVLLEAVPRHIDLRQVHGVIRGIDGVEDIQDLHVWTLTSGVVAMSAHVVAEPPEHARILHAIHERMHRHFGIRHVTVEMQPRQLVPLRARAPGDVRGPGAGGP